MNAHTCLDLADARARELRREASRARLAALARCCRPSTLRRAADAVLTRLRPVECCA